MMLDTAPPRDFFESKSDDESDDIFEEINEWISALEEVSDDDLRSWIELLEERARDGPRDNEEVGWLKAMKDEMTGRDSTSAPVKPIMSAKKLIKLLERDHDFTYNEHSEVDEGLLTLGKDSLVFNYEGDFIAECDDAEEEGVEEIYQVIRKNGWSLDESPLDVNAWVLSPTNSLKYPLESLLD
jgi:hypothetical protein